MEIVLKKNVPALYKSLGIYLPLITTNCAVLGYPCLIYKEKYNFVQSIVYGMGQGLVTLALLILPGVKRKS